jgi:small subunit ribosomal protein S6
MAKYEIMLVVDGTLEETAAKDNVSELIKLIDKSKDFKVTELGLKTMAYEIRKMNKA